MGWTSYPMDQKPGTRQLNEIADREIQGPHHLILERSAWTNWNTRRFTLFQTNHEDLHHPKAYIAITIAEYRNHELFVKTMDESEGPYYYDCPLGLLAKAEQHPPTNKYSRNWRAKVHQYHQRAKEIDKLLKQLYKEFPYGDRRLVIDGQTAIYYPAHKRRRTIHAYQTEENTSLYRIDRNAIDLEKTALLRQEAQQPASLPAG